ncbi:CRISPR-associated helicase Cas3' [Pseudonocardia sp. H11422]|uniref:CRISPR-associated helicase Cas3' n=1 Tax=Pseudonocardia sp. H11422 TaxID=2835866 RepID=UPI001BDBBB2B|nr:CRISPR-associated helicase Cas3' [Pseudonocardia sp. H11422]
MSEAEAWLSVWAKTGRDPLDTTAVTHWLPLHQHLADTAGVAGLLVDRWMSPQVLVRLARDLDGDVAEVRRLVTWLAAVHDVGKASPAFAVQNDHLADMMRDRGLAAPPGLKNDPQRSRARHEYVGQHAVRRWLADELGFNFRGAAAQLAGVVGAHHGVPSTPSDIALVRERSDLAGRGEWEQARAAVLRWATDLVGGPAAMKRFADATISRPSQVLLTAVVILADWIASNDELFRLDPLHTAHEPPRRPDPDRTAARVAAGWKELELPPRWAARPVDDVRATFAARFCRDPATVRPVQVAAVEAALAQERPGLVVVEAPMGEGKTEAALLAAEALAARSGADGCFVALPTRATTDAMFGRVLAWMRTLPDLAVDTSVMLAHGTASLNDEYRGLLWRGRVRDVGDCGDEAGIAHHWLRGRKKGPLAQFVIGTVDQVLVAGLKSRHLMLRHLALAGKVVVIDEVHAYDVYMSSYLDRVLHWLGSYGTPVVLLSATLPAARRAELVAAYDSGRGGGSAPLLGDPGYPVVLASGSPPRPAPASGTPRPVVLEHLAEDPELDDLDALVKTLRAGLADNGCAVVVRNTVARVQKTADRLVAEFGEDHVTVAHSRFLACDRARLDAELLRRFGPPGHGTERPPLHVVVASQVVEQSLDVDFDLMITDLAPVDLVLQRMGRLHRHARPRPPALEQPRCVLTGVEDWAGVPVRAIAGSRRVYGEHVLLRAAALLTGRERVTLPIDIAPLVQAGYGEPIPGPTEWHDAMRAAQQTHELEIVRRRAKAAEFLLGEVGRPKATLDAWVRAGVGDTDADTEDPRRTGQVRDGAESVEVLVVQRDRDGGILTPDWIPKDAGVQIPLDEQVPGDLARTIAACALRLPVGMSQLNPVGDGVIRALEQNHYASFDRSPLLSGQLVLVLDGDRTAELRHGAAAFRVTYDPGRGLLHEQL